MTIQQLKTVAVVGYHLGIAVDEVNERVRAAILKDVLSFLQECPAGKDFMLHLPLGKTPKLNDLLAALNSSSTTRIKTCTYSNAMTEEVDAWCRYTVKEEVQLNHRDIIERDFRVDDSNNTELNDDEIYPLEPAYNPVRTAPPSANPLNRPMPNPYARPWFQFAKKK